MLYPVPTPDVLVELVVSPQLPTPAPGELVVQYHVVGGAAQFGLTTDPEFVKHDQPPEMYVDKAVFAALQLA